MYLICLCIDQCLHVNKIESVCLIQQTAYKKYF